MLTSAKPRKTTKQPNWRSGNEERQKKQDPKKQTKNPTKKDIIVVLWGRGKKEGTNKKKHWKNPSSKNDLNGRNKPGSNGRNYLT